MLIVFFLILVSFIAVLFALSLHDAVNRHTQSLVVLHEISLSLKESHKHIDRRKDDDNLIRGIIERLERDTCKRLYTLECAHNLTVSEFHRFRDSLNGPHARLDDLVVDMQVTHADQANHANRLDAHSAALRSILQNQGTTADRRAHDGSRSRLAADADLARLLELDSPKAAMLPLGAPV